MEVISKFRDDEFYLYFMVRSMVMGLLGASLTALISMLNGIAGAAVKEEKPEFMVIKELIGKLDKLDRKEQPMRVDVEGDHVTVTKGEDVVRAKK